MINILHVNIGKAAVGAITIATLLIFQAGTVWAMARGYASDDQDLQPGMAVALSSDGQADNPKVERATADSESRVIGVAVNPSENFVTTGSGAAQVYVQSDGEVDAYVSDINGIPRRGDLLAVSPLKGVLVVADGTMGAVIGSALEDFDDNITSNQSIDKSGTSVNVRIDKIRVNLDHKSSLVGSTDADSSLERLGRSIVGRDVGEIRVIIALIIFFIVLVAEGGIIYGAVSSAITSLGRNPLARRIIVQELVRVVAIALLVLAIGLAAIYGILWI